MTSFYSPRFDPRKNSTARLVRLLIGWQHAEELATIYIYYSTGDWFNTPPSSFDHYTCVQLVKKYSAGQ